MVRKQGGLITDIQANENVVDKCLAEVRRVEPTSLADKLFHITIKADAYKKFTMNGFTFTTDGNGNFSSIAIGGSTTPEILDLRFESAIDECVLCFIY